MKKSLLFLIFAGLFFQPAVSQRSTVDEKDELVNIVFKLAEKSDCFANPLSEQYLQSIDKYFAKYKSHILIRYLQNEWAEYTFGCEEATSVKNVILIEKNRVAALPDVNYLEFCKKNQKWGDLFIPFLQDFYKATNFHKFYKKYIK
ncbi:MAG: DUF4932 domain-containing protein [Prevotellaceae bacterium]|nr:DUF4932 domain-containing protein [Prevotellaceae bacterium]